jgi:NAD(P)-dependent dehydrogenase (short-subunit alcohol dehydrogenase family)
VSAGVPGAGVPGAGLTGKIVVVTGAAQGIGLAYAQRLADEGAHVVLADLDGGKCAAAAAKIAADGGSASSVQVDVADEASCQRLADDVADRHGQVDGLVNNAAIFSTITMKPFWEISVAEWDTLMAVNLRGPWLLTKALLAALRRSPGASIVNVASDALWLGRPGYLHYVASKAGVYGLTHSMAHELGPDGIRVNTVSPGPVFTEVARETVTSQQKDAMLAAQAIKRPAGPQDMVGAVVFLLSDDSGWMTGQTLHLNGGLVHR